MSQDKVTPELTTEQKLNLETAKIEWIELQRFFAQGLLIRVGTGYDLISIASEFTRDNSSEISKLMENGAIRKATVDDARIWQEHNTLFWAIVTAPWVLVQEINNDLPT